MMKTKIVLAALFEIVFILSAVAQNKAEGVVISAEDNLPVIGASVKVVGTQAGVVTDVDGKFLIKSVPDGAKQLSISYIGKITVVADISSNMKIILKDEARVLNEVVVTALGISKEKKSLGYAVQDVKGDALTQTSELNVANALQGKVSGVQISQAGGAVGSSQRIIIRGNSSFNSNNPLVIVDGVPIENESGGKFSGDDTRGWVDTGSSLNDIDPDDIENISVLKGGSAALYGMRAGNGVILITTKKGGKEKGKLTVSYDGSFTVDNIFHLARYQNTYGQGYYGSEYYYKLYTDQGKVPSGISYQDFVVGNYTGSSKVGAGFCYVNGKGAGINDSVDESWGPRLDSGLKIPQFNSPLVNGVRQATDWISHPNNVRDFFQTGYSQSHNLAVSNVSDKGSYRAALGYRNQKGTVPNTDQTKYNATLSASFNVSKVLSANFSMMYNKTKSDNLISSGYTFSNPLSAILNWFGRQVDMKDLKAHYNEKDALGNRYNWISSFHNNPYFTAYNTTNSFDRDRLTGKASVFLHPIEWFKLEGRLGYDSNRNKTFQKIAYSTQCPNGWFRLTEESNHELNADVIGYFNKVFGDFSMDALVGANYMDKKYELTAQGATSAKGLAVPGLYTIANVVGNPYTNMVNSHIRSNSVYGNVNVGYAGQLYAEVSARNDWSSTIKKSFFYPSFSLSWIPTETFKSLKGDILNYLKVRFNLANVGNATSAYMTKLYYSTPEVSNINGVVQYFKSTTHPFENLKPENIQTRELGLEASLFKNRIRLDFAYYRKSTKDQIMTVEVPASTGFSYSLINAGKVDNKGLEISITANILKSEKGINWTSTLNWSKDNSKVVSLTDGLDTYTISSLWDFYCYAKVGETWGTLYGAGMKRDSQGRIVIGSNGLPILVDGQKLGSVAPDWLAGWNNELSYKNFSFGFLLDYRKGGVFASTSQMFSSYSGQAYYTAAVKNDGTNIRETGVVVGKDVLSGQTCVTEDGTVNTKTVSAQDWFHSYQNNKELDICDGSYLKLREMHLTYTFPKEIIDKTKFLKSARLSLVGNNIAILWLSSRNYFKIDPESTMGSDNKSVGLEPISCPPTRSIGLKLNLTF